MDLKMLSINYAVFKASLELYAADRKALYSWAFLDQSLEAGYPYTKELDGNSMVSYFNRMPDIDITPLLSNITAPTLVMAGAQDGIVPPAQARLIASKIPKSKLIYDNRRH